MIYGNTLLTQQPKPRRKVFVSYYHADDQACRDAFEKAFGHLFISKSVQPENNETDLSTDYVKSLIQDGYISDTTVFDCSYWTEYLWPQTCGLGNFCRSEL
ncbi:MAG: hypothetical protein HC904_09095 [Blastochloris sp.]|nr:hypothetical protein [Blastochloris sp.]